MFVQCVKTYSVVCWSGWWPEGLWVESDPRRTPPGPPHCRSYQSACCPDPHGSAHTHAHTKGYYNWFTQHWKSQVITRSPKILTADLWEFNVQSEVLINSANHAKTSEEQSNWLLMTHSEYKVDLLHMLLLVGVYQQCTGWWSCIAQILPVGLSFVFCSQMRQQSVQRGSSSSSPCSGGQEHPSLWSYSTGAWPTRLVQDQSSCWPLWAQWEEEDWRGLSKTTKLFQE